MRLQRIILVSLFGLFLLSDSTSTGKTSNVENVTQVEKSLVDDGSFVHNTGQLQMNITNLGLIGTRSDPRFNGAPSGRWPGSTGLDHLWAAGLWIGGIKLGEQLVSTGQPELELLPTANPEDVIYDLTTTSPNGSRYPGPNPDDDDDGLENEDPPNGQDDDNDGLVDEDGAIIGDQYFRCEYQDFGTDYSFPPPHEPLNIRVVQESFQWSNPVYDDFVAFDFKITNEGSETIDGLYIGLHADFDINGAQDDLAGFFDDDVETSQGETVRVKIAYMADDSYAVQGGYMGIMMLDHPTDPNGISAPMEVGTRTFQKFNANTSYDQGGDPTNDQERYQSLSMDYYDANSLHGRESDYRILVSCGPFNHLENSAFVKVSMAIVAGATLDEMVENAAEAVVLHRGCFFDRDEDPATGVDGMEFLVHWLEPGSSPSPVPHPINNPVQLFQSTPNPFNPSTTMAFDIYKQTTANLSVYDLSGNLVRVLLDEIVTQGHHETVWNGKDDSGKQVASGTYFYRLRAGDFSETKRLVLIK